MIELAVSKVLSANDTGETGGHQAGLLIPKQDRLLSFFPALDASRLNPRVHLLFEDDEGRTREFAYIYYNNRLFGGTRNEYRLTRMTKYIREARLTAGDQVVMQRRGNGTYSISYRRVNSVSTRVNAIGETVIKLGSGWRVITVKENGDGSHRRY